VDVAALIISIVSLLTGIVGTYLANRRASEAIADARKASAVALWSDAQIAVQRFIGFDPATEPIGDRLTNYRIAMIALVDGLDGGWDGFDAWLEAERQHGTALGREVMAKAKSTDTIEDRLKLLEPYQVWAAVLGANLRKFRATGYDAAAIAKLRQVAERHVQQIHASNGWTPPPTSLPGVKALDE